MPSAVGSRIGPYEITGVLGRGAMGEVYRGRDPRLERDVALKVLPETFSHDRTRVQRFEREAKALAALNHPNIAQIYGVEECPAASSGDASIPALVIELVEGEDLAERVARGPIPWAEALPLARQIADALGAAHEHGIVHRDLKPANIKVTLDGVVKVLDFGLARLAQADAAAGDRDDAQDEAPTISAPAMTRAGMILGTAAYMSPEQAKGRIADKRSDVWAFGCVLYEMLVGRRPFPGDDLAETLASVLKEEPDWTALPPAVPAAVRTFLQRSLIKDRHRRVADIGVAQFVLAEQAGPMTAVHGTVRSRGRAGTRALALAATAVVTAFIVGAGTWILKPAGAPPSGLVRFAFQAPDGQGLSITTRQAIAISPDGRQIVYSAGGRLYQRSVDELESHAIPGTDVGPLEPVFSPDGESIAFYAVSDGTLKRTSLRGGTPTSIVKTSGSPFGMSWGERGIVFGDVTGIALVSPNGGTPEKLVSIGRPAQAYGPQILPGGGSVLFTLANLVSGIGSWDAAQIVVQSLTSGERKVVIDGASDGRYLSSGHLVYAVSGRAFAVGFDLATEATVGERVPVLAGVRRSALGTVYEAGPTQLAVADSGALAYVPGPNDATSSLRNLVLFDRTGGTEPLKLRPAAYVHPRASPDGARLAVGIDNGQQADIWIYDLNGASAIRRLTLQGRNRHPVWSPDGRRVAFQSDREGDRGMFSQPADGSGPAERLSTAPEGTIHVPESWSPDGKHLLFSEVKEQTYALLSLSVADKSSAPFGDVRSIQPTGAVFSPDGRWVAYTSTPVVGATRSTDRGVFVQPFPATGVRFQAPKVSIDYHPTWARDGRQLFYSPGASAPLVAVAVQTQPQVTFASPVNLPQAITWMIATEARGYDVLPDGRFLGMTREGEAALGAPNTEIRVVLNWFDELKRLVPVK